MFWKELKTMFQAFWNTQSDTAHLIEYKSTLLPEVITLGRLF